MKHNSLGVGEIHRLANWEYATAAARLAATGFTADDVGKIAKQIDSGTFWELTAVTPTWAQIGGGSNLQVDITIGTETSNEIEVTLQLQDSSGNNITSGNHGLFVWLSDNATPPHGFSENPPEGVVGGVSAFNIITDVYWLGFFVDGELTISIQETSATEWYLCILMPDGSITVSDIIEFV
jgi:hypothetical protein